MAAARWEFEDDAGEGELSAIDAGEFIEMEGEFKAAKVGEAGYWEGPDTQLGGPPVWGATYPPDRASGSRTSGNG